MIWGIDVRLWQAIVAGAVVAIGWLVNGWQNRRDAARLRAERLRDVHRAIYAEIGANLANLGSSEALIRHRDAVMAQMAADPGYVPFIPVESRDTVFTAVVEEIHVLPRVTIDPIVEYYAQIKAIAALQRDMREAAFTGLSPERRAALFRDYMAMKDQALAFGENAIAQIAAYARGSGQ